MKRLSLSLLLFLFFSPISAYGETFITSGTLASSTTWTQADSPYIIQNYSLSIPSGVELDIQPGVEVKFDRGIGMQIEEGAILNVLGDKDSPVIFTSNDANPAKGDYSISVSGNADI